MLEQLSQFIQPVAKTVSHIFLSLAFLTGANFQPTIINRPIEHTIETHTIETQTLGATISAVADFRTSLNAGISSSATTMTLVSFTSGSETLTAGAVYGFKIGGSEYVIGTASTSNQIVSMTRGLSRKSGTSTVAAYQRAWGRGTAVEMTDAPILLDHANKLNGVSGFEVPIKYDSTVSTSTVAANGQNLASVAYANSLSFGAIAPASETAAGFSELATGAEAAAGTSAGGTTYRLVLPAVIATSTWNSAASAANKIPVTNSNGIIASGFVGSSTNLYNTGSFTSSGPQTFTGTTTLASSTIFGSLNAFDVSQKRIQVFTASSTFTVPSGVKIVDAQCVGGGGGAGGNNGSGASGGGGAGAYSRKLVDVSATTSIFVQVGAAGIAGTTAPAAGGTGGTSAFGNYISAVGGNGSSASGNIAGGAAGGTATGGDINSSGGNGGDSFYSSATVRMFGMGGSSYFGSSPAYGAGGNGCTSGSGQFGCNAGNQGICIITY